ncbi:hypothetical protein ACFLQW_02805 [Candidatus Zixiibacteriota bacterium]
MISFARIIQLSFLAAALPFCLISDTVADSSRSRATRSNDGPYIAHRVHKTAELTFPITNWGTFGNAGKLWDPIRDPETGAFVSGIEYKSLHSEGRFQMGALWIGALVDGSRGYDTLVTTGQDGFNIGNEEAQLTEFFPESFANGGDITVKTNDLRSPYYDPEATATQEFSCVYYDTLRDPAYVNPDYVVGIRHRPLNVRVRQDSYTWSYKYANRFAIIHYWIVNLGQTPLHELRVGILVAHGGNASMVGFLPTVPILTGQNFADTVMAAWCANAYSGAAFGVRFLDVGRSSCLEYDDSLAYSFNWWAPSDLYKWDWGPQRRRGDKSLKGGRGHPLGDAQKYRYLANGEIDYDQHLANLEMPGWIEPIGIKYYPDGIFNLADGHDTQFLLSVGPFELAPGDSIPLAIAVAAGDRFHADPQNYKNLSKNPEEWYNNLDFTDLNRNLQMAARTFDNPGVDTDGDGCAGRAFSPRSYCRDSLFYFQDICWDYGDTVICWDERWFAMEICDSIRYAGDGIPDFKGPPPPPSPKITIHGEPHIIRISWDGQKIEHFYDPFALGEDFEGYNVYSGIGDDPNNMTLMASWDVVNFDRYRFIPTARPSPWVLDGPPLTLEQIADQHDPYVDPFQHADKLFPYEDENGDLFYFKPHGGNRGNEYLEGGAITDNPIQYVRTDSLWDESSLSWKPFGHYECTIDNLLPSQPYYFAVTAFDAGVAAGGIESLESPIQANMQQAYPTYSPDYVEENRLKISVYPNPYRIDGGYRQKGYEDPNREGFKERVRRIHFVNLPPKATIKIFSLDGDLIRELHHPASRFSDTPSHTAWDMITRNTQAVTSGIYLYTVESAWGTQIGKIVIIK